MSTKSTLDKLEACSTLQELSKLADVKTMKAALRSYLKSQLYHAKHNAKVAMMVRVYKEEHPDQS